MKEERKPKVDKLDRFNKYTHLPDLIPELKHTEKNTRHSPNILNIIFDAFTYRIV